MSKLSSYLSILTMLSFCAFLSCPLVPGIEGDEDPTVIDTPSDPMPYYDTDGDGISNAVETNSANAHHGFDTTVVDANPSIAHGTPTDGWLEGGINLPDQGRGYYHHYGIDPVDRDDWGTLTLINMVEGGGRNWMDLYFNPRIGILDMSLQNGGPFTNYYNPDSLDHVSHQNGLDVDVRYVRNDGQEIGLDIASADSIYYDPQATADLMNSLIQNGNVTVIFIDTAHAHLEGDILQDLEGHSNHFHVRIEDPDGTGN
jgi:murein endopeptidase